MAADRPHSKVLYTGFANQEMYDLVAESKPAGFEFVTLKADSNAERMEKVVDADYVILFSLRMPDEMWEKAQRLKMIQLMGVGYHDMLDLDLLKRRKIRLGIAPAGTGIGVSEHAIMLMAQSATAALSRQPSAQGAVAGEPIPQRVTTAVQFDRRNHRSRAHRQGSRAAAPRLWRHRSLS